MKARPEGTACSPYGGAAERGAPFPRRGRPAAKCSSKEKALEDTFPGKHLSLQLSPKVKKWDIESGFFLNPSPARGSAAGRALGIPGNHQTGAPPPSLSGGLSLLGQGLLGATWKLPRAKYHYIRGSNRNASVRPINLHHCAKTYLVR